MEQEDEAPRPTQLPRQARRINDSIFDRIYKHIHDSKTRIELSAEELAISDRWEKAWFLLCAPKTIKTAADELVKMFSISTSTAYEDVKHAMILFGDPRPKVKEYKRAIAEEIALRKIEQADKRDDHEMSERYFNRWLEITGLKDHAMDGGMAEMLKKFRPHTITITSDPTDLIKQARKIQADLVSDIEHEDVP